MGERTTTGIVVCDQHGNPVWVGNPETTDSPTITVYHDYGKARRALGRIYRATEYHAGVSEPLRLASVTVTVTKLGEPITPLRRPSGGGGE